MILLTGHESYDGPLIFIGFMYEALGMSWTAEAGTQVMIFLSAKGDIVDKSIGFKAGGDDYVVKPFSFDELLLRIEAHLRRHKSDLAFAKAITREGSNKTGDIEVCFNQYEVRLRGEKVDLTAKEFEILALLAASPGQVFTRAQIFEHIWARAAMWTKAASPCSFARSARRSRTILRSLSTCSRCGASDTNSPNGCRDFSLQRFRAFGAHGCRASYLYEMTPVFLPHSKTVTSRYHRCLVA